MQLDNTNLRQFLDNCLYAIYFLDSQKYSNYIIRYIDNSNYDYAALYTPIENELTIIDHDFNNEELICCTALHELAHHIQYIDEGETKHDTKFNSIHKRLLEAAFSNNLLDPSKLLLSETYLSCYKERSRIISVCLNYLATHECKTYNMETRCDEPKRNKKQYQYSTELKKYYRFVANKTKKTPHLIEK